ncbi:MAG: AAA family ATPase [Planctomycetaceae bacterium]|jgi:predicted ATPase|nr:AAA family ATPase [Planctomycetaceae bacterium]
MLTRVDIANYRGFKSYRMEGLAQVNLVVGKNNSGKTALLEGLHFLTSGGDIQALAESARRRGEVVRTRSDGRDFFEIAHFFYDHRFDLNTEFSFTGSNGTPPVAAKVVAEEKRRGGRGKQSRPRRTPSGLALQILIGKGDQAREDRYQLSSDGAVLLSEELPHFVMMSPGGALTFTRRGEGKAVRYISTDSIDTASLAAMRDEVLLSGQESDIDAALRILEPDLLSVQMLSGVMPYALVGSRAGAVVAIKGKQGRFPIGSMGDGMRRLLALATSLAVSKGGSLFVDEIDTGLHYSVMADMWKLVVKAATGTGVQVFATTHSWDCIEGLSLLCQREPELLGKVAVHTIDRKLPHSVAFTGESVVRMVKHQIDPR